MIQAVGKSCAAFTKDLDGIGRGGGWRLGWKMSLEVREDLRGATATEICRQARIGLHRRRAVGLCSAVLCGASFTKSQTQLLRTVPPRSSVFSTQPPPPPLAPPMPGPSTHPRRRQRTRHGHSSREDTPEVDDPQARAQPQSQATASELVQWVPTVARPY